MNQAVIDGGRNPSYEGRFNEETPEMHLIRLAQARRIAALESDLAAAQSYATTLAVSMHRHHYAEAAPNWQPLPDLVGLLTQIDNMYAGLRNDLEAAEVENKRLVGANLATLREDLAAAQAERDGILRIKEAADVLYSEAEEYDLPDGLGMGASQQYWDDLANALFPDDSDEVIRADLEKAQAAIDGAWEAFNEELNKPEFLPCGHHRSLMLKSAETGQPLYCELCDCIGRRNDFQTERDEARAEAQALRDALCMIYDKYEDGPGCQEGFDCEGIYIGNAVMLSKEEEDSILALIPQQRDAAIDAAKRGGE